MTAMEARLADFKDRNGNALPSQLSTNLRVLDRIRSDLVDAEREILDLEARRIELQLLLNTTDPHSVAAADAGQSTMTAGRQLAELRQEYLQLTARYGTDHPDVRRVRRQISELGGNPADPVSAAQLQGQLSTKRAELETLLQTYAEDQPDVVKLRQEITALEASLARAVESETSAAGVGATNPEYIQSRLALDAVAARLRSASNRRAELLAKEAEIERNVEDSPRIEQELLALNRDYESLRAEYEEIRKSETAATLSERLEAEHKGERYTLIGNPTLPANPTQPDRVALVSFGLVLALGLALAAAALADAVDHTVKDEGDVSKLGDGAMVVVIPHIDTETDVRARQTRRRVAISSIGAAIAAASIIIYLRQMSL